jgi:predicted metal-dependent enzyme (double-stranded beta helix superfamily)
MASQRMPALQSFIDDLRAIWASDSDIGSCMEKAKPLLEKLVQNQELQARSVDWPSTEGRKNLLLYVDEQYEFAVNAVVRVPGRKGSVHDHAHAWVLYGVLCGTESLERYERIDDRSREDFAQVRMTSVSVGSPGKVDLVPPFDIHAEQGGPTRSVAIILRSTKLGDITQRQYDAVTGEVRPGPGPTQIPFELTA